MEQRLDDLIRPVFCKKCRERYVYKSLGVYECPRCGFIEMDNYGKVRNYIEESGPASSVEISAATGVSTKVINEFLRQGRLEIPDGSPVYINCEKCGTEIRYGRFCPTCAGKLAANLKGAFVETVVGEVPKDKMSGKTRFLNTDRDKRGR